MLPAKSGSDGMEIKEPEQLKDVHCHVSPITLTARRFLTTASHPTFRLSDLRAFQQKSQSLLTPSSGSFPHGGVQFLVPKSAGTPHATPSTLWLDSLAFQALLMNQAETKRASHAASPDGKADEAPALPAMKALDFKQREYAFEAVEKFAHAILLMGGVRHHLSQSDWEAYFNSFWQRYLRLVPTPAEGTGKEATELTEEVSAFVLMTMKQLMSNMLTMACARSSVSAKKWDAFWSDEMPLWQRFCARASACDPHTNAKVFFS